MSFARSYRGVFSKVIKASATIDPTSVVDGGGGTYDVEVVGARLGDFVRVAAPYDLQGVTATAYVSAADQVTLRIQNESTTTVDFASGVWKFVVEGF